MCQKLGNRQHTDRLGRAEADNEQRQQAIRQAAIQRQLARDIRGRLESASFQNYQQYDAAQGPLVKKLLALRGRLNEHVAAGQGLILAGPVGTGKDHLAVSLLRTAARLGWEVRWVPGQSLYAAVADACRTDQTERQILGPLIRADVLCISDPALPFGGMTPSNLKTLYRVVSERNLRRRSTWATMNIVRDADAAELLGPQTWSRLLDGAEVMFCNWPDFRRRPR